MWAKKCVSLYTETEVDYVTVLDFIVPTFEAEPTRLFRLAEGAEVAKNLKGDDLCPDEPS